MYMAKILSVNQNNIKDFKGVFGKISLAIVGTCALILPANFSTAAIVICDCIYPDVCGQESPLNTWH